MYITINKDLKNIKSKEICGMSKKQFILLLIGCAAGLAAYFFLRKTGASMQASMFVSFFAAAVPFAFMVDKPGSFPLEKIIKYKFLKFIKPDISVYKTENIYSLIDKCIQKEESKNNAKLVSKKKNTRKTQKAVKQSSKIRSAKHSIH